MEEQNQQATDIRQQITQQITALNLYKHTLDILPDYRYNKQRCSVDLSHLSINGNVAIMGQVNIRELKLSFNKITHIEFIKSLSELEDIDLYRNPLSYLPNFDKCYKLKKINCSWTNIDMFPYFPSYMPLEIINCSWTNIKSLEPLCGIKSLKIINAECCTNLKDISYLFRESKTGFFTKLFLKPDGIKRMECVLPNLWHLIISTEHLDGYSKYIINGILNGSIRLNRTMRINGMWVGDY